MKKILFTILILFSLKAFLYAQTVPPKVPQGEEAWRFLKEAEDLFEANDYGQAFAVAEKAKEVKKAECDWEKYHLEKLMKKSRVRKAGTKLNIVMQTLQELDLNEELGIIQFHLDKKGPEYFKNNYDLVVQYVNDYYQYPEADFLIAKIYNLEGENQIALDYMNKAYKSKEYLDISSQKYDILNEMAKLSLDMQNYADYEKYLLLIASDNEFFSNTGFMTAITNLINDKNGSMEKFFLLYRCEEITGLEALIELCDYYVKFGEAEKALKCSALASVIAVTRIDSVLKQRLNGYEYTTFGKLLSSCAKYEDIVDWGNESEIWKLFYVLGDCASLNGKILFAKSLYTCLAQFEPEPYWRKMSELKMIK